MRTLKHLSITFISIVFLLLFTLTANAAQYKYDSLNRLTEAVYDNGTKVNYIYDPAGNIISVTTVIPYIAVSSTDPVDKATGVLVDKAIGITFSEAISSGDLFASILLQDANSNPISSVKNISGNTLNIDPDTNLSYGTTYTVVIPVGAVKSTEGKTLASDYTFSFSTVNDTVPPTVSASPRGGTYDKPQSVVLTTSEEGLVYYTTSGDNPTENSTMCTGPIIIDKTTVLKYMAVDKAGNKSSIYTEVYTINTLKIIASNPEEGKSSIPVNIKIISVMFNSDIKAGQNYGSISLKDSNSKVVSSTFDIDKNRIIIRPSYDLKYNAQYTVIVPKGAVCDPENNALSQDYSFSFITESEDIELMAIDSYPRNNAVNVTTDTTISITFNKNISAVWNDDERSKSRGISLKDSTGKDVQISYSVNGSKLIVKPKSTLAYDTRYELTVPSSAIWDMDKSRLKENFVLKFTTEKISLAIASIDNIVYKAYQNEKYNLPSKVKATMSDGSIKEVDVVWNINSIDTTKPGVFLFEGTVAGYDGKVKLTLIIEEVKAEPVIEIINDITDTVTQNDNYNLPKSVTVTMSNKTTKDVSVLWNIEKVDTSKIGTFTYEGAIEGYNKKVILSLEIKPKIEEKIIKPSTPETKDNDKNKKKVQNDTNNIVN